MKAPLWGKRLILGGMTVGLFGATAFARGPLARVAIVTDRSTSIEKGDGSACGAVGQIATAVLSEKSPFGRGQKLAGLGHNIDRDDPTTIELWATGDRAMPGSPRRLGEQTLQMRTVMEDFDALLRQRQRQAERVGAALQDQCRQVATAQQVSPIYSALVAAVASLKNGCPQTSECLLAIQSDLVETHEKPIKTVIDRILARKPAVRPSDLPRAIDLENRISVFICGYGVSSDAQLETQRTEIVAFWRQNLLIRPKTWAEEPVCPGYAPQR